MPQFGRHTGGGDDGTATSMRHRRSRERHRCPVGKWSFFWKGFCQLVDRQRLTRQRRLIGLQIERFRQPAIGRNEIAAAQLNEVSWDQIAGGEFSQFSVAPGSADWLRKRLECRDCFFRPPFLCRSYHGVRQNDHANQQRVGPFPDDRADHSRNR